MVRRRPLPATGLRLDDYEASMENPLRPYPFGLEGARFAYQNAMHHLFADHVERNHVIDLYVIDPTDFGQPAPVVNMVAIRQLSEDSPLLTESLHHVLDESPNDSSEGSTRTLSSYPTFPLGFGGMIFHISHDSVTKEGETTEEHDAHLAKNANRQRHRDVEAAPEANEDGRGPPRHQHNLDKAFDMVGDQLVYQTPSANLAVAFNELDKLSHTLEVKKVRAHITVVQVQVNEFWNDAPSYSTASAHSRRSCHDGGG